MDLFYLKENQALRQSENVIRSNSATFYKAFKAIQNSAQRKGVFAVYAFCRYADDLIDENNDVQGLNQLKNDVHQFFLNPKSLINTQWRWRALDFPYRKFYAHLPTIDVQQPYLDMIRGQEMDIAKKEYETIEELLDYCYCVASSVGLMLLPILAPKTHKELETCALHLGYAMQLTNILRDIGEDYRRGRIYLPKEIMNQAKYTKEMLSSGIINDSFRLLVESLAKQAEHYYTSARSYMHLFPSQTRHPLAIAALLYEHILTVIRREKYDVFTKKNFVNDEEKYRIIKAYREGNV